MEYLKASLDAPLAVPGQLFGMMGLVWWREGSFSAIRSSFVA